MKKKSAVTIKTKALLPEVIMLEMRNKKDYQIIYEWIEEINEEYDDADKVQPYYGNDDLACDNILYLSVVSEYQGTFRNGILYEQLKRSPIVTFDTFREVMNQSLSLTDQWHYGIEVFAPLLFPYDFMENVVSARGKQGAEGLVFDDFEVFGLYTQIRLELGQGHMSLAEEALRYGSEHLLEDSLFRERIRSIIPGEPAEKSVDYTLPQEKVFHFLSDWNALKPRLLECIDFKMLGSVMKREEERTEDDHNRELSGFHQYRNMMAMISLLGLYVDGNHFLQNNEFHKVLSLIERVSNQLYSPLFSMIHQDTFNRNVYILLYQSIYYELTGLFNRYAVPVYHDLPQGYQKKYFLPADL